MKKLIFLLSILLLSGCSEKRPAAIGETPFQKQLNADFKDASISPLKAKDLKNFKALEFFSFDESFIVQATLIHTPDSEWFEMRTTTDRVSRERIYAVASFELKGKPFKLNIYQGEENLNSEEFKDYLFLPFLDNTNGDTTYGGGRYIDLKIPVGDSMEIDFNKAYNPYCVYNEKYSCPIVPRSNYLDLKVTAGLKMFKKEE